MTCGPEQLGPLYLFYGPESYLREHYLALARKKLTDGPAESFNYHRFNAENLTMDALQNAIEAMPMLAEAHDGPSGRCGSL